MGLKYIGDLYAKIGRKYLKLAMTSTDVDNLEAENKQLNRLLENNKQIYQSVKKVLPPRNGLFYDVIGILYNDNISGGYKYRCGSWQDGFFFFDHFMYLEENDFRNSSTQEKVIAWKFLPKCSNGMIREFCRKAGV